MKDFYEKIIKPEVDELDRLLDSYPMSHIIDKAICKHPNAEYVDDSEGLPPYEIKYIEGIYCNDCESWVNTESNFMEED